MTTTSAPPSSPPQRREPAAQKRKGRFGDRLFAGASTGSGILILLVLAGVAVFLISRSIPALTADTADLPNEEGLGAYIGPLIFGTLLAAVIALVVATPLAVGIALYITHYAPRRLAALMGYVMDLLAAIPSVVYGFWGIATLAPALVPFYGWLERNLGFIPLFSGPASVTGRTMLTVGLVLAVMILPIISAISREVFSQAPALHREAALALGATRWEMIRMSVLPYGKSGVIGGAMLGLGRALGETLAVAIVLSASGVVTFDLISSTNPSTIAANIALQFPESSGLNVNVLIASGLALFVITLAVNMLARWVVNRRADFSGAN
ncbi:phosphate ABC transporter permease subunit PstC [Modestobacter altitudinis]|uniref:phosphate ABC transporter permease subunit PstC n=1 Tax=Modestobacter altitudinis TaxID=2213158 RepID=UPI00110CB672|nr:phosphate ABC transporter permease subunit PstC [Modestobacter altitudinis]